LSAAFWRIPGVAHKLGSGNQMSQHLSGIQLFFWIPAKLVPEWFDRFGGSILGFIPGVQRLYFPATDIIQLDFNHRNVKQT
jgi:hypothetical protein